MGTGKGERDGRGKGDTREKIGDCYSTSSIIGKACNRVLRYLAGTKSTGLLFGRNSDAREISVGAYADADWGSDHTDRKSITGWADGSPW